MKSKSLFETPKDVTDYSSAASFRHLSILIAEHDKTGNEFLSDILKRAGYEVANAFDGEAALNDLERRHYNLVLVNEDLPIIDGIDVFKICQFIYVSRRQIPFIALTNNLSKEFEHRCEQAGIHAYLQVPVNPEMLVELVGRFAKPTEKGPFGTAASKRGNAICSIADQSRSGPINLETLDALEALGGKELVDLLGDEFCGEGSNILSGISTGLNSDDLSALKTQLSALRAMASNIGAEGIENICFSLGQIPASVLREQMNLYFPALRFELQRVATFFARNKSGEGARPWVHH